MKAHRTWCIGAAFAVAACAAGPDYSRPELNAPQTFSVDAPVETGRSEYVWWNGYGDAELSDLIARARAGNLDIQAAAARLQEAEALVRRARADLYPRLDGSAGAETSRTRSEGQTSRERSAQGNLLLSWVPDLFGATRRTIEAADAERARRDALVVDAERLMIRAVVQVYLALRRDEAQYALVTTAVETRRQSRDLVAGREDAGLASNLDTARAAAELASAEALLPALAQSIQAGRTALAVLAGGWPQAGAPIAADGRAIPLFSEGPALRAPQTALLCRADVRAAEADLARAYAEIGVAEAERYGALNLAARLSASVIDFGAAAAVETMVRALSAQLDVPLFDAGGRRAEVVAAKARAQAALITYRIRLLNAAQDAELALAGVNNAKARRAALNAAEAAGLAAYNRAQDLYRQGLIDFFAVLDAQRTLLDTQQDRLEADADLGVSFADLYSAIGVAEPAEGCATPENL